MTCDERRNLMPLYVADALDAAERDELRRHLASGCAACAGALAEMRATFAAVSLGLDPIQPSPAVRERLMARVDCQRKPIAPPSRPWAWRVLSPLAAAGIAAAVTFAVLAVRRPAREAQLTHEADGRTALLREVVQERDRTLEQLRQRLAEQRQLVDALQKPDTRVIQLAGSDAQPHAAARLVWDSAGGRSVLLAGGLAPPPPGKTYELWYVTTDQRKVRAATFDAAPDGSATVTAPIPAGLAPLAVAAVTDEPAGGVDVPTGHFQLLGKVP